MRIFFVRLVDTKSCGRVALGNFPANNADEALDAAKNEYPGFFDRLFTTSWQVEVTETKPGSAYEGGWLNG